MQILKQIPIEYWLLALAFLVLIVAFVLVRLCYLSDKKQIENEVLNNQTIFFVEHNPLKWEDVDFQSEQYPTIILPEGNF